MRVICIVILYLLFLTDQNTQVGQIELLKAKLSNEKNDRKKAKLLIDIGEKFLPNSPDSALFYSEKAIVISKKIDYAEGVAEAQLLAAKAWNEQGKSTEALSKVRAAEKYFRGKKDDEKLAESYYEYGSAFYSNSHYDSVIHYLDKALKIYNPKKQQLESAKALRLKGLAYWGLGLYLDGLESIDSSLVTFNVLKDSLQIAAALNTQGAIYWGLGSYEKALESFFASLYLRERLSVDSNAFVVSYNNIGMVYQNWNHHDEALKYFQKAKNLINDNNPKSGTAYTYLNLGTHYKEQGQYDDALSFLNRSMEIYDQLNDLNGVCLAKIRIGECYTKQKKYSKAEKILLSAVEDSKKSENRHREALAYLCLAKNEMEQNKLEKSMEQSFASLEIAEKQKYKNLLYQNYGLLANLYEQLDEPVKSLEMLKKTVFYKDLIYNETIAVQYEILELTYENEQKQFENEQLRKQSENREKIIKYQALAGILIFLLLVMLYILNYSNSKRKKELQKANEIKDKVFAVVSHDLRAPVGNLNHMIDLMVSENLNINYRETLNRFKPVIANVYNMLENLLIWAKANRGKLNFTGANVGLHETIKDTIVPFGNIAEQKSISLEFNPGSEIEVYTDPTMLQIIVRNLVNNAIKFTPENGQVIIETKKSDNQAIVSVSDTGVGIPKNKQDVLFDGKYQSVGTQMEKGSGLGLALCREIVEITGGRLWFSSTPGVGSTFSFSVPLSQNS